MDMQTDLKSLVSELKQIIKTTILAKVSFGLRDKDGKFYIGNKKAKIKENNIIVGDKEHTGTPGLWELIVATTSGDTIFTNGV